MKRNFFYTLVLMLSVCLTAESQITWPEGQLLPSFPAPAETQDLIYLRESAEGNTAAEMYLFSSMKGLINRTKPRIFSYEGDNLAEGAHTWFNALGFRWNEWGVKNTWDVLTKYKDEIDGLVVYDPNQIHTVNLAIPIAHRKNALIASPDLLPRLQAEPYNFEILQDLRGQFSSVIDIYNYAYENFWKNEATLDKRILINLSPENHKSGLREYAVALGTPVLWLEANWFYGGDPIIIAGTNFGGNGEKAVLVKFLSEMPKGGNCLGWWTSEQDGVELGSIYGLTTIASDYCVNLTFHSGTSRTVIPRPMPAKPKLENKIYVAFILSDGDNLQYIEHVMLMLWNRDARGTVPMGWTVSPAMIDAMPGALNYYHQSSTDNDNLLVGPSGYGYTYPDYWTSPPTRLGSSKTNAAALAEFAAKTEEYNVKAGLRAITVWNTIENGISANATKNAYADNMPTLLGITTQNTGGTLSIYNSKLPSKPLTCNYCTNVAAMKEHINSAANGWNERIPLFLIIQAENWANSPATFKEVADSYKDNDNYKIVRPDHIFQLIREYNGLTINPGGVDGDGDGLTGVYFDGDDFKTRVITRKDTCVDFNWVDENGNYISPAEGVANNNYSVRWTGKITPRYTGGCTFYVTSDRGCRLWVNDELLFDKWSRNSSGTESGTISLTAGEKYDIKLEYHRARSGANCKLEWASPMHSREVVPLSFLYEDPNPGTDPTGLDDMYAASGFRIYPDPSAREILNIETGLSGNGNTDLTVYDISGKVLWQQTVYGTRLQLNTSRFSKGVCLISVRTEKYSKTVRYIVR